MTKDSNGLYITRISSPVPRHLYLVTRTSSPATLGEHPCSAQGGVFRSLARYSARQEQYGPGIRERKMPAWLAFGLTAIEALVAVLAWRGCKWPRRMDFAALVPGTGQLNLASLIFESTA